MDVLHVDGLLGIYASVSKAIFGSDRGLSPVRRQAIIWTNAGLLSFWILRNKGQWKLNRNRIRFTQENNLKMSSVNWRSFSLDFNVLNHTIPCQHCNQPPRNGSTNHVFLIMWSLKTPPDIKKLFRSMIYAVTVYIYFAGLQLPWVIFIQGELNFRICLNSLMPSDAYMRQ